MDNCNYNQPHRRHYHRKNRSFDTQQTTDSMTQNCYNQDFNSSSVLGGITEKGSSFMAAPADFNSNWNSSDTERPCCRRRQSANFAYQQPIQPAKEEQMNDIYLFYPTNNMEDIYSEQYGASDYIEPVYEVEEAVSYYPEYGIDESELYQDEMVSNVNYGVEETCSAYGVDQMPVGMGYVPCQQWRSIYEPEHALDVGTIFQELDLAFMEGGCLVK